MSLNNIIDDILLQLRNSVISESEHISRILIELWIHNYRAVLIKQDIDLGRDVKEDYIQYLDQVHLDPYTNAAGVTEYKSNIKLPKLINFRYKTGIVSITDGEGNLILFGSRTKMNLLKARKYTKYDPIAYLKDGYLYVDGLNNQLEYINVGVIAENPADIDGDFDPDATYPVPASMVSVIKNLIFTKELAIMVRMPSDVTNNTKDDHQNKYSTDTSYRRRGSDAEV